MRTSSYQNTRDKIGKLSQLVTAILSALRFPAVQQFMLVGWQKCFDSISQTVLG